uniref:Sas10 domain-containing protein n=1 Tax=Heterorhabditis bacteriophora TaxID=37862 RepID=A0A1I7XI08_HETBA
MPRRNKVLKSDHIDFESDNEIQDDIDAYHAEERKISDNSYRKKKVKNYAEEVLNVEGDLSGESEDDDDSSDFDDYRSEHRDNITGNQWGKKRKDFYGTSYVDEDWGGMREEELEDAELEEEDARSRQCALDVAASNALDVFNDEDNRVTSKDVAMEPEFEWNLKNVKKLNRKTVDLLEEYNRRKDIMTVIVEPLVSVVNKLPADSILRTQLLIIIDVYSSYIMNMMFFLKLKTYSLSKKNATDVLVDEHPVIEQISKFHKMVKRVDVFLENNCKFLNKLMQKVTAGEQLSSIIQKKKIDKTLDQMVEIHEKNHEPDITSSNVNTQLTGDKRMASATIAKNCNVQGIAKRKTKNAKAKNRLRYINIKKKVRSQVGTVRREINKYSGEARGIRTSTIKSTKLIA